jgi:hypothetical protein
LIVSVNQPAYLPWLGYFHRIAVSDLHIVLDHVQFEKNSVSNRNKIRTAAGWCWLTVPVATKGRFGNLTLDQLELTADEGWARKHALSISQNYRKANHFPAYWPAFEELYRRRWSRLADLAKEMTRRHLDALGIATPVEYSSSLKVQGAKSELVLRLCQAVGATAYLSGPFGRSYLDLPEFQRAGIKVVFHDYAHPTYEQVYPGFEPYMAAIDLLFNQGPHSHEVMSKGNLTKEAIRGGEVRT